MPVTNITRINEKINVENKPTGWVVRQLVDKETKRLKVFEFGIYVNNTSFVSIGLDLALKPKLIRMNKKFDDGYTYSYLDENTEVGISTYKTKNGLVFPVLVPPSEQHPAVNLAAIAVAGSFPEKILNFEVMTPDTISVRDYIDPERSYVVALLARTPNGAYNAPISFNCKIGVEGIKSYTVKRFTTDLVTNIETETITIQDPEIVTGTEFIMFDRYMKKPGTEEGEPRKFRKKYPKKPYQKRQYDGKSYEKHYDKNDRHFEKTDNDDSANNNDGENRGYNKRPYNPNYKKNGYAKKYNNDRIDFSNKPENKKLRANSNRFTGDSSDTTESAPSYNSNTKPAPSYNTQKSSNGVIDDFFNNEKSHGARYNDYSRSKKKKNRR